jgi:Flp pilus assembly pilin Flp
VGNYLPSRTLPEEKQMLLRDTRGQTLVEYIILISITVLIVGGAVLTLTQGIRDKLLEYNNAL